MDIRTRSCIALSRFLMKAPIERDVDYGFYGDWRNESLSKSLATFSDAHISDKEILDFGCGDGQLSLFLANVKHPLRVVGVDINASSIERARISLSKISAIGDRKVEFIVGSKKQLPVPDQSFDTLIAFDCLEHVMAPDLILRDWYRVLRPGGRCLIEWYPYKGPWGPHMEVLIPVPWAHVLFGEKAMFRAAEAIYDLPEFVPRHWDLDEAGNKKPNKWRAWSSFDEQGFINKLDVATFLMLASNSGFQVARNELHSFSGSWIRKAIGRMLMKTPIWGEYFVSHVIIELLRPE